MATTAIAARPASATIRVEKRLVAAFGALAVAAVACLVFEHVAGAGMLNIGMTLFAYVALAEAWNVLGGLSGQMSLGVGGFVGTSAYAMALTMSHLGWPWPAGIACGGLAAGALSALLAFPLLRLRGDYFAVGTLAASMALGAWVNNWSFAGGSSGISLPVGAVPTLSTMYEIGLAVALVAVATTIVMRWSTFGVRLLSIREDDLGASLLGVGVFGYRLLVIVVSGILTGLAGGVFALSQINFVPSDMFGMSWTVEALVMVVIGGMGTVVGPIVGAVAVYYGISTELATYPTLSLFIEGGLLLAIVRFVPGGLWPFAVRSARSLGERAAEMRRSTRPAAGLTRRAAPQRGASAQAARRAAAGRGDR